MSTFICELFIFHPRIPLKHFILILVHVINIPIVVSGGIWFLASNKETVLKWCINRADIAKNTGELEKMSGVSKQHNIYKPLRSSQILPGEKQVTELIRILEKKFMNPFGVGYNELHNLSSGKKEADDLAASSLEVYENGKKMRGEFIISRINSNKGKFNNSLKRFNVKTFKTLTKYVVKCKHAQATVEINRNILGSLLPLLLCVCVS